MIVNKSDKSGLSGGFVNRVILGVMKIGFAGSASAFLSFVAFVLAVRWVSKEEIGAFVLFRTIGGIGVMLADMGLGKAAIRFIAMSAKDERRQIINATLWVRLLLAGLIALLIAAAEPLAAPLMPSSFLTRLYLYLPLFVFILSFSTTCEYILQGLHHYGHVAVAQTGASLINLALTCLLTVAFGWGVQGLIVAMVASETLSAAYQFYMLPWNDRAGQFLMTGRNLLRFGFPLQLNNLLTFLFRGIDPLLIAAFLNPISVAYFNVAARIPDRFGTLLQAFISVYYPHMAELFGRGDTRWAETFLNHSLRLLGFLTLFIGLAVTLFQGSIVSILFTDEYLPSAPAFAFLMISLAISSIGNPLGNTLVAAGYPSLATLVNLVNAGVHTIASVLLIPTWGFMGAVYSALLSNAVSIPVLVWVLRRKRIAVDTRNYVLPFVIFGVCVSVSMFIQSNLVVVKLSLLGAYVFLSMVFAIVTKTDISTLLQSLTQNRLEKHTSTEKLVSEAKL